MKTIPTFLVSLLAALSFSACADDAASDGTRPGVLKQESSLVIADLVPCDALTPCEDGTECVWIGAADLETPVCINADDACDLLDCGDDECAIMESYPAQIACSGGNGGGDDHDDCGDDNEPVCNTPDGSCDPGSTEPGSPGPGGEGESEPGYPGDGVETEPSGL